MHRLLIISAITIVASQALAQNPSIELKRLPDGFGIYYRPSSERGVAILHFAPTLQNLTASNVNMADFTRGGMPLAFDVSPFVAGDRGFFNITELPGLSLSDFAIQGDLEPQTSAWVLCKLPNTH